MQLFSQTSACNSTFPFEEKEGLLTIVMESGIINDDRWKIGSETIDDDEIKYLRSSHL